MRHRFALAGCLFAALATSDAQPLAAQQVTVEPASTHIFPAGGRRGSTLEIAVGGECLPPFTRLRWSGAGLTSPVELGSKLGSRGAPSPRRKPNETPINYARQWQSSVEIAADAPLGAHLWRLASARGGTGGRVFLVGDLPEFIETEPNSTAERAERVTLPVTLNGQIEGERDLDYYVFSATEGEVVTAEVIAARLGGPLEALVELYDTRGRRVPVEEARVGSDPVVAARIPTTGEYRLVVSNLNYLGGPQFVYRVNLSTAPFVKHVFPPGWQAGQAREFELAILTGGGAARVERQTISLDAALLGEFRLARGPLEANLPTMIAGAAPEIVEVEPNGGQQPMKLAAPFPLTINGRFATADDDDWFEFSAVKGATLSIECAAAPRTAQTLPIISLHDANGGPLGEASAVDQPDRRAVIEAWSPPADGVYRLRVRDLRFGSAGSPELAYRVSIAPAQPDFAISLANDFINVIQGAKFEVEVRLRRRGGFAGPVKLSVADLPQGVKAEPLELAPGQEVAKLAISADTDCRPQDMPIKIVGVAEIAGKSVTRVAAAAHLAHDAEGAALGPLTVDNAQLTVQHKPVFKLFCNEAYQYAYRGTEYPYLMQIERLDGFDGPITLEMADRQIKDLDGIEILDTTIPPGSSTTMLPLYLPETMHINVQAHSNVYSQGYAVFTDKWGQRQSTLVVSTMRCMIRPLPTVARLRALDADFDVRRGETVTCRVELDRTANFAGPVRISLAAPSAADGFSAEPVMLAADQSTIDIAVRVAQGAKPPLDATLVFRAVGEMPAGARMVSEARLPIRGSARPKASAE